MEIFLSEFMGTLLLVLMGNGVVANVLLKDTKGSGTGWLLINFGWSIAIFIAVMVASKSGAHLNPAVSIAMLLKGTISSGQLITYIAAQMAGAFVGACLVYFTYKSHYDGTDDQGAKLGTFSTAPAKRNTILNLLSEVVATFVLVFSILYIPAATNDLGGLSPLPVALIVLGIGMSLGGTTGYAINPARDLGPRIAHALLPIKDKGSSDWSYAWIPVVGPILGGIIAVLLYNFLNP